MAVAAYKSNVFLKATAGAPLWTDRVANNEEAGISTTRATLDTNYLGSVFTSLIMGQFTANLDSLTLDYVEGDPTQALLRSAHENDTAIYVTIDPAGLGTANAASQAGFKVTTFGVSASAGGKVTLNLAFAGCTNRTYVTAPTS